MLPALLVLALQAGPNPAAGAMPVIPDELTELRRRQSAQLSVDTARPDRLQNCLARADQDRAAATIEATNRLKTATGLARAQALHCIGYAQAGLGRWSEAARNFLAARDVGDGVDVKYRARLGAIGGTALLSAGNNIEALGVLEQAARDAQAADFAALGAEIQLDRARALVGTGQTAQAGEALATARELAPNNSRAWLLSATLARRNGDLVTAQQFIEQASLLDPANLDTGLEAGVIAVLSGNDEAARRSWQSLIALAPGTSQAQAAAGYLEQIAQ